MNDDALFALVKNIDPFAVRLPPGLKAISSAIYQAGAASRDAIPEGWVLVPKEPYCLGKNYDLGLWSRRNWEAALEDMLTAVPKGEEV